MLNYSEQGRALTLLHGSDYQPLGGIVLTNKETIRKYLPFVTITLAITALFILKALTALAVILIVFVILQSKAIIKIKKRALDFEKDFATFLISLAASLRCGNEPLSALFNSREMFPEDSSVYQAISAAKEAADVGDSEAKIITNFAADIKHPELVLFRSAFLLARAEGASLSTCLERLAKVIRTRQSIRRKIKAAIAMQKLSAYGICAAVFGLLTFQLITAKEQLLQSWHHSLGEKMLMSGAILIFTGFIWMLSLTRSRL